jgi:hypothetical protein
VVGIVEALLFARLSVERVRSFVPSSSGARHALVTIIIVVEGRFEKV